MSTNIITSFFVLFSAWTLSAQPCSGGMAGSFPCGNVNLSSRVSVGAMGASRGNDVWGWRDPSNGRQYALMGLNNGTSFVDVTNAGSPVVIGRLPTASSNSSWRDIKVVNDHAFIVSEAGNHGMQVFDLTRLRGAGTGNVFTADTTLTDLGGGMTLSNSHNIVADEVNDYVYPVGANLCSGGLVAINVSNPKAPVFEGCFSADGYTHDAQVIIEDGRQYVLACNENSVTIVDVTDKSSMTQVSRTGFPDSRYIHQGWATEDNRYFLVNDEFDESNNGHNTRTHIFDIQNLSSPTYIGHFEAETPVTDHNLYVVGDRVFQANYQAGLQIYDLTDLANAELTRVGYFDTYTSGEGKSTIGSWSVYPFFGINKLLVSNMDEGLFILDYNGSFLPIELESFDVGIQQQMPILKWVTASEFANDHFEIEWSEDGVEFVAIGEVEGQGTTAVASEYHFVDVRATEGLNFYRLRQVDADGSYSFSEIKSVLLSRALDDDITISPNPMGAGETFTIAIPEHINRIEILTLQGKHLLTKRVRAGRNQVSLASLPAGQYLISIFSQDTRSAKKISILP